MFHPLKLLAHLPNIRKGLLGVCFLAGLADFLTSIILLAYQLVLTTGFNRVVPSLVVTSFLTSAIPVWFLFSKPYAIRLPIASANMPAVGSKRDKVAKFTRSIMMELIALGGVGAWTLITVADLHAETPGLIHNCGGWTICLVCLLTILSLCLNRWITILFQCLAFASLLISTLYFSIRRHSPIPTLFTSFSDVDWIRYSGRPVNRAATVKRVKQSKANTSTVPEDSPTFEHDEAVLRAPARGRFGDRPDSQVHVLSKSIHSTYGGGGAGGDSVIDWDVQSNFSSNFGGRNGFRDSTATSTAGDNSFSLERPDQVFILVTEKEEEQEKEKGEQEKTETGTAM
ncbi:uncharacterized protein JCM15063_004915 [Sporobolomyces koalae]|uniref:uncharacterized protein n=1 Tax=Sporobolomyces koalae TaxID=500713 RepID=UPI00318198DD